jgi:hypothetical protein
MGKPKPLTQHFKYQKEQYDEKDKSDKNKGEKRGIKGLTSENSSERRHPRNDEDMLTVFDDNVSISGYSDLRSQRSRSRRCYRQYDDNRSA